MQIVERGGDAADPAAWCGGAWQNGQRFENA
jgi:hypothetical protein